MSTLKMLSTDQEYNRQQFVDNLFYKALENGDLTGPVDTFIRDIKALVSARDEILQLTTGE